MGSANRKWQPLYFGLFSIIVVAKVAYSLIVECVAGCSMVLDIVQVEGAKGAAYATVLISTIEVIRIMVILPADYLSQKFVEPLKERQKEEGRKQGLKQGIEEGKKMGREEGIEQGMEMGKEVGREEGMEEGIEVGRREALAEVMDWLARKQEAEEQGLEFDEPMPGERRNGWSNGRRDADESD